MSQSSPWTVTAIDRELVDTLADRLPSCERAVQLGVDLIAYPHQEDDQGHIWTRLSAARRITEVTPGAVVVLGSAIGRYLATGVSWDFEVDPHDPIVVMDLLPIRPSEVERFLARNRRPA